MLNVLWCLIISFITTYISMPVIIHIAEVKKLFDIPDNRKVHSAPIPALGGVGIFGGFMFACLLCISFDSTDGFQFYLGAAIVLFFIGLKDDLLVISPSKKFMGQLLAAFLLVYPGKLQISNLHGLFGIQQLSYYPAFILSMLAVLIIVNAFNLIDGLDGLAGTLGIISCALMGMYFINNHIYNYAILAFAMSGSIVA
ncbi:MAG TPA: MraY family glycosyltransferase, partial [Flavisolibacter sp.]|nr:MraY family glycosyltransferase [Flavisolibacter sp.]